MALGEKEYTLFTPSKQALRLDHPTFIPGKFWHTECYWSVSREGHAPVVTVVGCVVMRVAWPHRESRVAARGAGLVKSVL